jgi:hypothetical protein
MKENPPPKQSKERRLANTIGDKKRVTMYGRYVGFIGLAMAPVVLVSFLIKPHRLDWLPVAFQWCLVVVAFLSALYIIGLIVLPWSRPLWLKSNFYDPGHWWGLILPLANTVYIACMATGGFAIVSGFLYLRGLGTTTPEHALTDPVNDCWAYYIWGFVNAIPVLDIPQTLGWEMRFRFTDHINPVLLLFYKLVLIGPMIATGKLIWQDVRRREDPTRHLQGSTDD